MYFSRNRRKFSRRLEFVAPNSIDTDFHSVDFFFPFFFLSSFFPRDEKMIRRRATMRKLFITASLKSSRANPANSSSSSPPAGACFLIGFLRPRRRSILLSTSRGRVARNPVSFALRRRRSRAIDVFGSTSKGSSSPRPSACASNSMMSSGVVENSRRLLRKVSIAPPLPPPPAR